MNVKFKTMILVVLMTISLSFFNVQSLSAKKPRVLEQTDRLAALCRVWGLLKYYHPEVATGTIDWDQALIDAIPAVKAAEDYDSFNQEIDNLILQAGDVVNWQFNPGTPAHPGKRLFKWTKNCHLFSASIRHKLKLLYKKYKPVENYYATPLYSGNASFHNEKPYTNMVEPDENYRLLALFRYWNMVEYFFPYKDIMDSDWGDVLETFIPKMMYTQTIWDYFLGIKELSAKINDSHAFCSSGYVQYYFGYYQAPVEVRFIESKTIVTRVYDELMVPEQGLRPGDIILKTHGIDIDQFRDKHRKYVAASNESAFERNLCNYVIRAKTPEITLTIDRGGQVMDVTVQGYYAYLINRHLETLNAQETKWKILPGNIGFVHMGVLKYEDIPALMDDMAETDAIIFDFRYYPEYIAHDLITYLAPEPAEYASYYRPDFDFPGTFYMDGPYEVGAVNPDYYRGKVVVLIDERTQSRGEWSCMIMKIAPNTTIIGSQTAGADGNISQFTLPGGMTMYFSGIGVFYPDGTETQRIGIVPDIEIKPTVQGIRQGRDELVERAVQLIESAE